MAEMMHSSMTKDLFDVSTATHVAVSSGAWSDPKTWSNGNVPGEDAKVHIPMGIEVEYDAVSNARLEIVRVDGALDFATDTDTRMLVESFYTGPSSRLTIGTEENPVDSDVTASVVFADGKIDLVLDPERLGHGLVAEGQVIIQGAEKSSYTTLLGEVAAGAKTLELDGNTSGWAVGDTIVVMGTKLDKFQDEYREIVSIKETANGLEVVLDRALDHDHTMPDGHDLSIYVGNSTRNVVLSSENPDGVRGHVMMMHTPDVSVKFAEFDELGRTDKSLPLDVDGNVAARYPLHLHETGTELGSEMSVLHGNSVHGSPGWGIVQHSSNAAVDYNFVHDIDGAGIVSEDGDETGQWIGNFVTGVPGTGDKFSVSRDEHTADFGHSGVAYENQARQITQQNNIAANTNTGWMFRAAEVSVDNPNRDTLQFDPAPFKGVLNNEEPAIIGFHDNVAIGVGTMLHTGHRQDVATSIDLRSDMIGLVGWEIDRAFDIINYTGEYVIRDSLFIGAESGAGRAIRLPNKHEGTSIINSHFENFSTAIYDQGINNEGVYVGNTFKNVDTLVDADLYGKERLWSLSDIEIVDQVTLKIDASSDLTMGPRDGDLYITGTITDSAGTLALGSNRWAYVASSDENGIDPSDNKLGDPEPEDLIAIHGAMRDGEGGWIMPVAIWVTDRVTGEHFPFQIDIKLVGYEDSFLEAFEISEFTLPSSKLEILDTSGIQPSEEPVTPDPEPETPEPEPETPDPEPEMPEPEPEPETPDPELPEIEDGNYALEFTYAGVDIPEVKLVDDFTIEAWVQLAEDKNINRADAIVGSEEFDLNFADGKLTVTHQGEDIVTSTVAATDGVWTHYAVVRKDGEVKIYADGVEVGVSSQDWDAVVNIDLLGDGSQMSRGLMGALDEVHIWDTARSEDTISKSPAADPSSQPLVSYTFEDGNDLGSGTQIIASSIATGETETTDPSEGSAMTHMEIGTVTTTSSSPANWVSVSFDEEIKDAVVVMGPVSGNGSDPATVQVRNVTDSGFEFQIQEWDYLDGYHTGETISWMALSDGSYTMADGRQISATAVETNGSGMGGLELLDMGSAPVLLSQLGTANNSSTLIARTDQTDQSYVDIQLQREEASSGSFISETVYLVAIEGGSSDSFDFVGGVESGISSKGKTIDFGASLEDPAFLASMSSINGGDTAALRLNQLGEGAANIFVEEETSADSEKAHIGETVSWIAADVGVYELF